MSRVARAPGVIAFVPYPWGGAWMPRHQVLTRLAQYFPVVWMDPPWGWREALRAVGPREPPTGLPATRDFLVYRPGRMLPLVYRPRVAVRLTERGRIAQARALLRSRGAETAILYLWRPEFAPLLDVIPHRVSCYHIDDEYSFSTTEQPVDPQEAALLGRADQVLIHSQALWEKKSHLATRAALVPNGVDYRAYATPAREPADLRGVPRPRIGYVGVVKGQLDMPLLVALAERHPEWSFVMVGPVSNLGSDAEPFAALGRLPNVHLLGHRPVAALPAYTQHLDVGIMPYDLNDYTKYIYPLKLHEYLAAGLPAVGTPIRTLHDFRHVVTLAEGADEWSDALAAALEPGARSADAEAQRRSVAAAHDWEAIVRRVALLLAERLGPPDGDRVAEAVRAEERAATSVAASEPPRAEPEAEPAAAAVASPAAAPSQADEEDAGLGRAALDRSLVRGIAWTGAVRWFTQVLSWASTLVVARLLTPGDFGLVGMATIYLGIIQLVNEFGIGSALVLVREMPEERRAGLGGLGVTLGLFFFLISAAAATPISIFFKEPAVRDIVLALATTFVIAGFKVLPYALLARDLEFRRMSRIDGFEATLQALATVVLAEAGYRYWSLVIGSIVASLTSTTLSLAARPHRIGWPRDFKPMVEPMTLGWQVTVSRVAWYAYSNADFAIVGRVLGPRALGEYSLGWQIASIPVDKVSAVLGRVTLPVFAKVQDDLAELRRYVKGLSQGLAVITFPLAIGLALTANHFVLVLLGAKWHDAILPLQLLSLYAAFRSLTTLFPQILISIGHARRAMWISIVLAAVLPVAFYAGTRWGTAGVAFAWMVAYPLLVLPLLVMHTLRLIGLSGREYLGALRPAISAVLVMSVAVLVTSWGLPRSWGDIPSLVAEVGVGAAAYLGTLALFHSASLRAFKEVLRSVRK